MINVHDIEEKYMAYCTKIIWKLAVYSYQQKEKLFDNHVSALYSLWLPDALPPRNKK